VQRDRVLAVWRRVLGLSWPIMAEQTLRTLMRTTDVIVTATFSPAAVTAIGLADLYARLPLRIGLGLGGGAIALSSQDTGRDAAADRDEAVTQALLVGALVGLPFMVFGVVLGEAAIAVLGASATVAGMGGTYLAIILLTAPARHVALIGARSLQGTGDTRTPMYVNVVSNALNIAGSVIFGLGLYGAPRLGIVGVGLATAAGNVLTAAALLLAIAGDWTEASFVRPTNAVVTRQLLAVSAPRVGEGLVATVAAFPFNSLLLVFGTPVNAGYQVGRRMYQQVTGPLSRGYNVAASVLVGQALGDGDPDRARSEGWATAALGLVTVGTVGLALVVGAEAFVHLFTDDPEIVGPAVDFARVYGVSAPFLVVFVVLSGALQGGSDTRTPFVARTTGLFGFMLGFSALTGLLLGWGPTGAYAGIVLFHVWAALVVLSGFRYGGWVETATEMMDERAAA